MKGQRDHGGSGSGAVRSDALRSPDMQCPSCGGSQYVVVSPGRLRRVTERVVDAVAPGLGGNRGLQPLPIYGRCNVIASELDWTEAAVLAVRADKQAQVRAAAAAKASQERHDRQRALERRRDELLANLEQLGHPGLQTRRVPGKYHLTAMAKLLGRVGEDRKVEVEPAWPIGSFTWVEIRSHGLEHFEQLPTGLTPSRRLVPMGYATQGDSVEMLYFRRSLPNPTLHSGEIIRQPATSDIVAALERALAMR